jgi:RNAse (barnase) inhibitor barstar
MTKKTIAVDGECFKSLDAFFVHFQNQALHGRWGNNLDAFNDVLSGGFGTPDVGFVILWKNHQLSKSLLGYPETSRVLRARLQTCHSSNIDNVKRNLARADANEGSTVFDWLVEIIKDHGPCGAEQDDGVELLLQ